MERWEKRLLQERKKQEKKKDVSQSKDAINNNRNTSTKDGDSSSNSDHFEGDSDSAAVVMSRRLRLQTLINRKPEQWKVMFENMDFSWREPVRQIFEYYAYRTPSTYITSADTHMSWHYRDSEITFAKQQVNDMISHLSGGPLSKSSTEVVDSHGMVQIRPLGVSKGFIALNVINELQTPTKRKDASSDLNFAVGSLPGDLSEEIAEEERKKKMEEEEEGEAKEFDFVLCLGNFVERDEDMFVMLNYKKQQGSLLAPLPSPVGASVSRNDQQTAAAAFPFAQSIPSPTDIYNNTNDDHDGNEGFNDDYVMHSLRHHRLPKPAIAVNILTGVSVTAINTGGACDVQTEVALKDKNGTAPTALTIDTSAPVTSHEEFNQIDTNASARFKAEKRPSIADAHADVYASAYGDANTYYLRPKSPTNTFLSVEESQSASPSHTQSYLSRSRSQSFEVDVTLSDDLHVSSLTSRTNSDGRYSSDHIKIGHHKHGGGDDSPTFHDVDSSRPHTCVEKETNGAANVGDEGEDGNVINIARRPYAQHINPSRDRSRSVPYQIKLTKSIHNNSKRASCANHDVSIHRERSQTTTNALSSQQAVDGAAVTQQQHSPTGSSIQVDQGVNDNDGCDDSLIENNTDSEEEDGTHGESPVSHEVLEKRSQSSTFPLSTYRMDRVHSDTEHQLLHRAQSFDHDGHAPLKEWIGHVPRRGSARSLSRDDVNANLHNNQNTSKPIDSFSVHHRSASMSMSNLARVVAKRPQLPLDLIHPSPSHPSLLASGSSPTFTALVTPSISIPSLVSLSTHNAHNHPHKSSLRVDVHSTIHDEEEGDSAQTPGQSPDVMQRVDSSWSLATVDSSASTSGDSNEHSADRTNNHDGNDNHIDLIHNGNSGIDEGEIGVLANHSVNRSIDSSAISIDFRSPSPPLCDSPSSLPTIVGSSGGSSLGDDDSNDDYGRSVAREGDLGTGMLALSPPLESTDISYSKTGHQLSASKSRSIYVVPSVISPDFLPAGSEVDKSGLCDLYLDISVEDTEELGADVDLEWRPVDDSSTGNDSHMIRSTTHTHLHTHPHIPVSAAMTHGTKTQSDVGDGSQGSDSAMGSPSSNMDLCGTINTPAETKSSGNKTKSRRRQRLRHGSAYLHSQQQQHHHHQTGMSVQYYQNQQGPQPASQLPVADEKSVMDERRNRPPSRSPSSASSSSSSLTSSSVSSLLPSSSTASTTSPSSSSPSSSSTTTTVAATSTSTSASASATSEPKTRKTGGKKKAKKNRTRSSGRKNSARSHALKKESSRQKKTSAGPSVYTVSVGRKVTRAQAYINNSQAVEDIMRILAGTLE